MYFDEALRVLDNTAEVLSDAQRARARVCRSADALSRLNADPCARVEGALFLPGVAGTTVEWRVQEARGRMVAAQRALEEIVPALRAAVAMAESWTPWPGQVAWCPWVRS